MIVQKFWSAFVAQINKIANIFWEADPIAQMQYEYDRAVEQLKEGRVGLEQYRGLVERVTRQVSANRAHVQKLEAETKAYLKAGDRATAAKFALELQKAKTELAANDQQLQMHETAYGNNLKKIKHANDKLIELRQKIQKYDAELKMSAAEAEIAKLAESFDMNLTTDFGQIEAVIQQKIDQNRGKVRVAADLSSKGIAEIQAEERMEAELAEQALTNFEVELGLKSPETTPVAQAAKDLGPAATDKQYERRTRQTNEKKEESRQNVNIDAFIPSSSFSLIGELSMANGQPRPAFYVAVLLVVLGLVGLAVWRYSSQARRSRRPVLERRNEADGRQRGEAGQLGHHDGQGIQLRPERQAARGQGHLQLPADGRSHRAVRDQRVGRLGADHLREQWLQGRQDVEDSGR